MSNLLPTIKLVAKILVINYASIEELFINNKNYFRYQ